MFGFNSEYELREYQKQRRTAYEAANLSPEENKKLLLGLLAEMDRLEQAVLNQEKNFREVIGMISSNGYVQNKVENRSYSIPTDFGGPRF